MKDFALGKNVLEYCNHPQALTAEGDDCEYDSIRGGYVGIHHPCFLTIDLQEPCDVVQISFKLYDVNDPLNKTENNPKNQHYAYRILCSIDKENWQVLYDTTKANEKYGEVDNGGLKIYRKGWQSALLNHPIKMRYFRIHALHNPANSGFHVVRVRLYDSENSALLSKSELLSISEPFEWEKGDAIPISTKLLNLSEQLSSIVPESYKKSDKHYNDIINLIFENSVDLEQIDGKIEQVRKIVAPHIVAAFDDEYENENKSSINAWLLTIGIIAFNLLIQNFISAGFQPLIYWCISALSLMLTFVFAWKWIKLSIDRAGKWMISFISKIKSYFSSKIEIKIQEEENVLYENASIHCKGMTGSKKFSEIFSKEIQRYDSNTGFYEISNPGWMELYLNEPKPVSYIRFLLWDNCGSEKKQPSHRKYNYRLLIAEQDVNNPQAIKWEAVYDNSKNPSNGWQEFYFEDSIKNLVAIKLQFFHTLSLSMEKSTKIVNIQAFQNPTRSIDEWSNSAVERASYAPPFKGLSKNRVVIGSMNKAFCLIAENNITKEICRYLDTIKQTGILSASDLQHLNAFKSEISSSSAGDLSQQINNLCNNIISPIDRKRKDLNINMLKFSFFSNLLLTIDLSPIPLGLKLITALAVVSPVILIYLVRYIVKMIKR